MNRELVVAIGLAASLTGGCVQSDSGPATGGGGRYVTVRRE